MLRPGFIDEAALTGDAKILQPPNSRGRRRETQMQTCETCRFHGVLVGQVSKYDQCRRHAPVMSEMGSMQIGDCWPSVRPTDWCGDYEPKDALVKGVDRG